MPQHSTLCYATRRPLSAARGAELALALESHSATSRRRIAKSTKGRDALQPLLERVIEWLQKNYARPVEALDPEEYKVWRQTIFPNGGPETYIEYLQEIGVLR